MAGESFQPLTSTQAKPTQVDAPIPGGQDRLNAADDFQELGAQPAGQVEVPGQLAGNDLAQFRDVPAGEEDLLAQFREDPAEAEQQTLEVAGGEQVPIAEPVAGEGGLESIRQQVADFTNRVAVNIAGSPEAQKLTLENRLGEENVKVLKNGDFLIRNRKADKFRRLDPESFELINDIIADQFKEGLQGAGGTIGAGLGAVGGVAAAPVTAGVSAVAAPLAAAGLGASIGGQIANSIGALIGVVRPEAEAGQLAQATEAVETAALFATGEAAFAKFGQLLKGRSASRALAKSKNVKAEDVLDESSKQALQTLEDMNQSGFKINLPEGSIPGVQGEVSIPASALIPHTPGVQATAKSLENEAAFQLVKKEAAEQYSNFVLQHVETMAGTGKGKLSEAVKTGLRDADNTLANNIKGVLSGARKREGEVIGNFRKQVSKVAGKQPLPSTETGQAIASIADDLGIQGLRDAKGKLGLQFPGDDQLIADLGFTTQAQLNTFKSNMNDIAGKLAKEGGLNIDDLLRLSKTVGNQTASSRGFSRSVLGRLAGALRADTREGMATILEPAAAAEYKEAIGVFRKLAKNEEALKTIMKDDVGANTFVSGLLSKGKKSPEALKAMKELVLKENPQLWNKMVGEFLEEAAVLSRDTAPGRLSQFNAAKFEKKVFGIGKENLETLMGPDSGFSSKKLKGMLELGSRMDKLLSAGAPDTVVAEHTKNAIQAVAAFSRVAKVNASAMFLRLFDKNSRVAKMVTKQGVEEFLGKVPQAEKGRMRDLLNSMLAAGRRSGAIETVERAAGAEVISGVTGVGQ